MKVNQLALAQWNMNCRKKEGIRRTTYKILRAIVMGKVTSMYGNGDYTVRYYDINLEVNKEGEVVMVWKDSSEESHGISRIIRNEYDQSTTYNENVKKANSKHYRTMRRVSKLLA